MRERLRIAIATDLTNYIVQHNGDKTITLLDCADIAIESLAGELLESSLKIGAEANHLLWYLLGTKSADLISPQDLEKVRESQDLLRKAYILDELAEDLMKDIT